MSTCGYLCPKCEGKGFTDEGITCDWCTIEAVDEKKNLTAISDEEWQRSVHEGNCCGDDPNGSMDSDQSPVIRKTKKEI